MAGKGAVIVIALIPLAAAAALVWMTAGGIGISPDSVGYIAAARNLAAGHGWSGITGDGTYVPVTAVPPLYSFYLALLLKLGVDPLAAARWLNVALMAGSVWLCGLLVRRATQSLAMVVLAQIVLAVSEPMLVTHTSAWTEPLFIFFTLAFFRATFAAAPGGQWSAILAAIVCAVLATMSRYAAISLIPAGVVCVLLLVNRPPLPRLARTAVFCVAAALPTILLFLRNARVSPMATGRVVEARAFDWSGFTQARTALWSWINVERVPESVMMTAAIAAILLLVAVVGAFLSRRRIATAIEGRQLVTIALVFIAVYVPFLLVSRTFVDPGTPLDTRILAPAMPSIAILMALGANWVLGRSRLMGRVIFFAAATTCLVIASIDARAWGKVNRTGYWAGYGSREWREAPTVRWIASQPAGLLIYTNSTEASYMLGGKPAKSLPSPAGPPEKFARLEDELAHRNAVIAYFRIVATDFTERDLRDRLPLKVLFESPEGIVMALDPNRTR